MKIEFDYKPDGTRTKAEDFMRVAELDEDGWEKPETVIRAETVFENIEFDHMLFLDYGFDELSSGILRQAYEKGADVAKVKKAVGIMRECYRSVHMIVF